MPSWLLVLIAVAITASFIWSLRRATELFCVEVKDGAARHVRGRMPAALLSDIGDVVKRPKVRRAMLRVVTESGRPRLLATGELHSDQVQQLRNVVGRFDIVQIRSGRRAR
jgi:hypothetical protein